MRSDILSIIFYDNEEKLHYRINVTYMKWKILHVQWIKIYAQTYPTDKLIKITDKLNLIQDIKMKRIKKKGTRIDTKKFT